ncbi:MAG TPA: hypothetical protein VF516_28460 [Kofleriaceae bacterium]
MTDVRTPSSFATVTVNTRAGYRSSSTALANLAAVAETHSDDLGPLRKGA